MALYFKRVKQSDAELLLTWRTLPSITANMFTDLREPTLEKQRQWIASLPQKQHYIAYMILDEQNPIGLLSFADIDYQHQRCSTGSYIVERAPRLKYSATLHTYICNYVFEKLKLNKIENKILNANQNVIKLQKLHKTTLVGCLKQHIYKNEQFHDVYLFEQLKENWAQQKQHFPLETIKAAFEDWN